MTDRAGRVWRVIAVDIPTLSEPDPDHPGWPIGKPGAYAVVDADLKNEQARFPTMIEALDEAERLNFEDVERGYDQDPVLVQRRRRLVALRAEGVARNRDERPERYAALVWSDDEDYWWTYATRADLEDVIREFAVERIVDLDTGNDVPFSVSVTLGEDDE